MSSAAWASYIESEIVIPGYRDTQAFGISNSGLISGTIGAFPNGFSTNENFITTVGGTPTVYNLPNTASLPLANSLSARGINDSGQVVGLGNVGFQQAGILRNPDGTFSVISSSTTCCIAPAGINNNGVIVGSYSVGGPQVGFVRAANGVFTTVTPSSNGSSTSGVNLAGEVVGNAGNDSFLFNPVTSQYLEFDVPGSQVTVAHGINDAGVIVGTYFNADGSTGGFIRNADGSFTLFGVDGAETTVITGINDAGVIVGYYGVAGQFVAGPGDGVPEYHAFVATPGVETPEPAFAIPSLACLAGLFLYKRRRVTQT